MTDYFAYAFFFAVVFLIVVATLTLHKIRRIHLAIYQLQEDATVARRESEALFGQLHALQALERMLSFEQSLPPMRGWAASPDMLLVLARHLLTCKPQTVAECSSGVSTVVAARCIQLNGAGHVFSLEHDSAYAAKTEALLEQYGLRDWATVIVAPLEVSGENTPWYRDSALPSDMPPIELLIIDGPPADEMPMARYPALPRLKSRLAKQFTIMLDDADRPGEQAVVRRWLTEFPGLHQSRPPCEKGLAVLEGTG